MSQREAAEQSLPPASLAEAGEVSAGEARDTAGAQLQVDWADRALRLQAEMENFRKRQQRWAEDRIRSERERLLRAFLGVIDDLERALAAPAGDGTGLRQGLELTLRSARQMLEREGVEPIQAMGAPFDPAWHEAVAKQASQEAGVSAGTVVQVTEAGYRIGDQLLRPAKVIVAA